MKLKMITLTIGLLAVMLFFMGCQPKEETNDQVANEEQQETENKDNKEDKEEDKESDDDESQGAGPSDEEAKALALDFSLSDGKGNQVNLADYSDKFVFLNFFTTWCGYCMDEMPEFQKIYDEYNDDVAIIIVNDNPNDVSVEEVVEWYDSEGYTFPMVIDEGSSETKEFYNYVSGYPTTFVYDKGGKYLGYISGALDEATMVNIINDYMKQ